MKKTNSFKTLTYGLTAALLCVSGMASAQAGFAVGINIGGPPPPPVVERPWGPPYAGAVWIPGHHQWVGDHWVWVGGYYGYPPYAGAVWVPDGYVYRGGRYIHHGGYWHR